MVKKSGKDNNGFDNPLFFLMVMDKEDPPHKKPNGKRIDWATIVVLFVLFACLISMCGN
jgi:hypothetical protein